MKNILHRLFTRFILPTIHWITSTFRLFLTFSEVNTQGIDKDDKYSVYMSNVNGTDYEKTYVKRLIRYRLDYSNGSCKGCQSALPSIVLDDFLFLGNLQNALNCELLEQLGIQHILNVCDFGLSEKIHQKFNVIEIPLMDAIHVDIKQHFDRTNTLLHSIYLKKERCLVHCAAGVSRSATIVLAYLMKYHHETLELAFSSLMVKRPQIFPNEGFLLQLVRYENELMKSKEIDQNEVSSHINSDDRQNAYDAIVDDKVDNNPIETLNEFKEKHDIHTTTTISNNEL